MSARTAELDSIIRAAIDRAIRNHSRPMPEYAQHEEGDYTHGRFSRGHVEVESLPTADADLTRRGFYCTYARRTTSVPLDRRFKPLPMYWSPAVFFMPMDNESMRPEKAYDGSPLLRGVKIVPVDCDPNSGMTRKIFGHLTKPLNRLFAFYTATGRRWEILRAREIQRCAEAGVKCSMPDLPAVDAADKKGIH